MKKVTLLLIILLCIATLCGCNEALTESLPESEAVSQTVSEVSENGNNDEVSEDASDIVSAESSEVIEIDYDAVLYSPSELDVYRGTMDDPQYFRENGTPLQGPSLEEYLEENTVSDDRYICVEFHFSKGGKSFDGKIDDVVSYLKDCGYIEDNARTDKNSSDMYSRGVIPYKGLKQLYEDNYALEYIWLYEAAPYDPTLGW